MKPLSQRPDPALVVEKLHRDRFPEAHAILAAGSVFDGKGTDSSDLDMVILYDRVEAASRSSFTYMDWPIETWHHDPETLRYFYEDLDRAAGVATLATMVWQGRPFPSTSPFIEQVKQTAKTHLDRGPAAWTDADLRNGRYFLTDLCDDIFAPRSLAAQLAAGARLYELAANFYFRSRSQWSAKGKAIPTGLEKIDSLFGRRFNEAFEALFRDARTDLVFAVVDEITQPYGGRLFDGYESQAPKNWRITK